MVQSMIGWLHCFWAWDMAEGHMTEEAAHFLANGKEGVAVGLRG
jgi:hypothetical protein